MIIDSLPYLSSEEVDTQKALECIQTLIIIMATSFVEPLFGHVVLYSLDLRPMYLIFLLLQMNFANLYVRYITKPICTHIFRNISQKIKVVSIVLIIYELQTAANYLTKFLSSYVDKFCEN